MNKMTIVAALTLCACDGLSVSETCPDEDGQPLLVATSVERWDGDIRLAWDAETAPSDERKERFAQATDEWTDAGAPAFVWVDRDQADVTVFGQIVAAGYESAAAVSSIGRVKGAFVQISYPYVDTLLESLRPREERHIALHEIGHVLGFLHEDDRNDAPKSCRPDDVATGDGLPLGRFDADSVMNLCNRRGELSCGDRSGVRSLYRNEP